jgi:transcription initiation factor IIE alpha subunit
MYYIKPKKSIYADHVVQEINTAVWKWRWNENKIEQLWCFCPTCNDELSYDNDHLLQTITFSCEHCNKEIAKFNAQNINAVLAFVKNEIRRILRKNKK